VQIFSNLMVNAVKFTPAGGSIRVDAVVADREAQVDIEDSGIGITPAELERIFDLSTRRHRVQTARAAALDWVCESSRAWWRCMAAPFMPRAPARATAVASPCGCRCASRLRQATRLRRPRRRRERARSWSWTTTKT